MELRARAQVAEDFGDPLEMTLTPVTVADPGANEVRIAVHAVGISFVDTLIAAGRYQLKPALPFTPGSELSGVVDAVGDGVTELAVGDRVCASLLTGALAEAVVLPRGQVARLPAGMSFVLGSVFRVSYQTAFHALVQRGQLAPGETVLVLGAGGAVGHASIQVAKALGATVIASASSAARREHALQAGSDHALDSGSSAWRQQVKDLTGGRGVDIVVDPVGGAATELAFRSLAWGGRHLVIGFAAGEIARLPVNLSLLKGAALVGVDVRQFRERSPELAAANQQRLFELFAAGALRPSVAAVYPFERAGEALAAAKLPTTTGRCVVEVTAFPPGGQAAGSSPDEGGIDALAAPSRDADA